MPSNRIDQAPRVLIVIPAYNEEESIVAVAKTVSDAGWDYVVINDGSTDKIGRAHV